MPLCYEANVFTEATGAGGVADEVGPQFPNSPQFQLFPTGSSPANTRGGHGVHEGEGIATCMSTPFTRHARPGGDAGDHSGRHPTASPAMTTRVSIVCVPAGSLRSSRSSGPRRASTSSTGAFPTRSRPLRRLRDHPRRGRGDDLLGGDRGGSPPPTRMSAGTRMSRNYGQHNALLCRHPGGALRLDRDAGRRPPEPAGGDREALAALAEDVDVVYGTAGAEQHGFWRDLASRMTKLALAEARWAPRPRAHVSAFRVFRTAAARGVRDLPRPVCLDRRAADLGRRRGSPP